MGYRLMVKEENVSDLTFYAPDDPFGEFAGYECIDCVRNAGKTFSGMNAYQGYEHLQMHRTNGDAVFDHGFKAMAAYFKHWKAQLVEVNAKLKAEADKTKIYAQ